MAKPKDPIYVWANQDVDLPGTGRPNKSKPIDDLLAKGYDKGQKPAAEEFNYILNMSSGWIDWIVNEKFPELEAEIARLLRELEDRIDQQLNVIRQDITKIKQDIADLRRYVDQKVTELKQEIQGVRNDLDKLRRDFDAEIAAINQRIDDLEPLLVPVGTVVPWPGALPPNGWLECSGQVFNTTKNPKLFGVLGRNTVPDYRGIFLRGWAHGSGAYDPDPGRALGSFQDDAMQRMTGTMTTDSFASSQAGVLYLGPGAGKQAASGHGTARYFYFDNARQVRTANENRPKNMAVMYIIKTDKAESTGTPSPSGINVSPATISDRVGYTVKATAQVIPANLASQYPVSWRTEDGTVATVDGSGNVTLVGPGTTNIVASISTGMSTAIPVSSYSLSTSLTINDPGDIQEDASQQMTVSRLPANSNEPITWLSNNSGVATINADGLLRGVSVGTATITARGSLSGVSTTLDVNIVAEEVPEVVQDNRLGVESYFSVPTGSGEGSTPSTNWRAPSGCVMTGATWPSVGFYYKPVQKKVNGVWVTITG